MFANFAKFAAVTGVGLLFLSAFEVLSWVVTVALIIPWVDAYSVWRGPTHAITEHHPAVFTKLSIAFVVPGGDAARLGLPDVLFFAVFLGASVRFGLRPVVDLARDDRRARAHDHADDVLEHRRAAGAAGDLARLPAPERRPDLAAPRPASPAAGARVAAYGRSSSETDST